MTRVVLVPGCWALLPRFGSEVDPVAELRSACVEAVAWLGATPRIVAGPGGDEVGRVLLEARAAATTTREPSFLVVANGSACRTEKAPGYFDPRAEGFDDRLGSALRTPDPTTLGGVDPSLAGALRADTAMLPALAALLAGARTVGVDYDGAPYGVQYWVVRWSAP